ncbi:aminotransferase class III-fold pyridoxal phosphate-dependent enzyme [Candidatus Woesearchaeota archaeon]|nr:aminotransferase class III-fold pyridoxal phosphate-dependent enzyme [Candidatus Woesearchaeota archaeon]
MKPNVKKIPGPKSQKIIDKLKKVNLGNSIVYPFVHSNKGQGCYFYDIDNNLFLDFASQIASNPLGYNNLELKNVIKRYSNRHPIKYAGQDFTVKEHKDLIEELLTIVPKTLNSAFLINSGAEAVENSIKICMRKRPKTKFGIAFQGSFHGRTIGALSLTHSKPVYNKNYLKIPNKIISFNENAKDELLKIMKNYDSESIGFVILEPIQGEGGYNVASKKMLIDIRKITNKYNIPLISDEVQSGMGRTGKWWAIENFNITPDVISTAKALQVGAVIANKKFSPEPGAISSTWGGGHILDLALGLETIKIIKRKKLLNNINNMGYYLGKRINELNVENPRGIGLMQAFDLENKKLRDDVIIECLKNGLVLLGCGHNGIRLIPPYIISKTEINQAIEIIDSSIKKCSNKLFKHQGAICNYMNCGDILT